MPRIFLLAIAKPPWGTIAPCLAIITCCPAAILGAPQMIIDSASPVNTVHTDNESAFGCGSQSRTFPV